MSPLSSLKNNFTSPAAICHVNPCLPIYWSIQKYLFAWLCVKYCSKHYKAAKKKKKTQTKSLTHGAYRKVQEFAFIHWFPYVVSVTCSQPQMKNINKKIPEISKSYILNHTLFWIAWWNLPLSRPVLFHFARDVNHPFVHCLHAIYVPCLLVI